VAATVRIARCAAPGRPREPHARRECSGHGGAKRRRLDPVRLDSATDRGLDNRPSPRPFPWKIELPAQEGDVHDVSAMMLLFGLTSTRSSM
jgi:hypothetical protein